MLKLPDKSPAVWQRFFSENRSLVYKYIIRQVEKGIHHNLPKVPLFAFGGGGAASYAHDKNYLSILEDAIRVFVKVEDYESASRTKKLIDEYHINKLIKESTEV
jgi:hypothetical protein